MAPVYDFRHVELDKIGRGKRIVKPPGGECSNIFGDTVPEEQVTTPRKAKNYLQSSIFTPDSPDSPTNGHGTNGHTTPVKSLDTQDRLFGGSPGDEDTPRRVINRQRSSIFEQEVVDSRPQSLKNSRRLPASPVIGEHVHENGASPNGSYNGSLRGDSPTSNGGTPNGNSYLNGQHNGHTSPESSINGSARVRVPPGGKSSGIF